MLISCMNIANIEKRYEVRLIDYSFYAADPNYFAISIENLFSYQSHIAHHLCSRAVNLHQI